MCVRGGRWLQHLDYPCPHSSQCKQTCNVENPNQTLELHRSSRQMRLCSFVIIRNNRPPREDVGFITVCTFPPTSSLSLRQFIHFEFCLVYSSLCYCQSMLRTLLHFIALSVCRFERTVCVYQIHCMRCMYFDTFSHSIPVSLTVCKFCYQHTLFCLCNVYFQITHHSLCVSFSMYFVLVNLVACVDFSGSN